MRRTSEGRGRVVLALMWSKIRDAEKKPEEACSGVHKGASERI
jgi:hypothetical protein